MSFASSVNSALAADGLHYDGGALRVRHLLEVLIDDVGVDAIAARVTRPLRRPARRAIPGLPGATA